jgi:hypothetical protein
MPTSGEATMFFIVFVFVFGLYLVLELILDATWNPFYYRYGIPIYKRSLKAAPFSSWLPSATELKTAIPKDIWTEITVHQLGEDLRSFRENVVDWHIICMKYTPIMHGALKFDRTSGKVKVVGFLNLFPMAVVFTYFGFICFMIVRTHNLAIFLMTLPLWLVFAASTMAYRIQRSRFDKVGETAVKLWSESEFESISLKEWH